MAIAPVLEVNEALSGIFGSISLAAWVFLLVPQLWENYRLGSAEGISLAFLIVWFFGDLANFFGSVWASLVPTVIGIAIYFCLADAILLTQCLYYNYINSQGTRTGLSVYDDIHPNDPSQPLLSPSSESLGLPGSRRRSSTSNKRRDSNLNNVLPTIEEGESTLRASIKNAVALFAVCVVGSAGWAVAWSLKWWVPTPTGEEGPEVPRIWGAEMLGYLSAIAYLGARIPQIVKNYREQSCEGLAILFFMLSLMGNVTYGASILFHSLERDYVLKNLPWLIGSLGTIVEDVVIFIQFHIYRVKDDNNLPSSSAVE